MTHDTNCQVLDEFRDEVEKIGRLYWEGNKNAAEARAQELGWERIGGGAGRSVWRVSQEHQQGPTDSATREHPCVVKFAISGHHHDGKRQNSMEVAQFKDFPPGITDGDPPVVVPLADWSDNNLWVSAPEVEQGGDTHEARRRLAEHGWECDADLAFDNVGMMHGRTVVLDYGVSCGETAAQDYEAYASRLEREGAENVRLLDDGDGDGTIEFLAPAWIGNDEVPPDSTVHLDLARGPVAGLFTFGMWDADRLMFVDEMAVTVAEDVEDEHFHTHIQPATDEADGMVWMEFEFRIETGPGEYWLPHMLGDFYGEFIHHIEVQMNENDPREYLQDVRFAFDRAGAAVSGQEISFDGGTAVWEFFPGSDVRGLSRPGEPSIVAADNNGFDEMMAVVGPWREGEPDAIRAVNKADVVANTLQGDYQELAIEWEKFVIPTSGVNLAFYAESARETRTDFVPDEVARLYLDIIRMSAEHLPAAPATGQRQGEIQDFAAVIEEAIYDTQE